MFQSKLLIAILGVFFVTSILANVCLFKLMKKTDEYSQYYPSIAYFMFLTLMKLHLIVLTLVKLRASNEPITADNFLTCFRVRVHYMLNAGINQIFAVSLCVYAIFFKCQMCYCSYASIFFLLTIFLSHYIFGAQFYLVQKYPHSKYLMRIALDICYYLQTALFFFSNIFATDYNSLSNTQSAVSVFLLYQICYHLFIGSPVFIIVCIFVFLQFIRVMYLCVEAMKEGVDSITYVLLGCLILLTVIYQLRIIVRIYMILASFFNYRDIPPEATDIGQPPITSAPEKRQYLEDDEIERIQVQEVHSIEINNSQTGSPKKVVPQIQCTVCDQELQKPEKILRLHCKHTFHQSCLVPWLKMKNSCPNCRTEVVQIQ